MRLRSKIFSVLLIAMLIVGGWAANAPFQFAAQLDQNQSGCHHHGGRSSAPVPAHDCCLTGHDLAVLRVPDVPRPDVQCTPAKLTLGVSLPTTIFDTIEPSSSIHFADPHNTAPLRL